MLTTSTLLGLLATSAQAAISVTNSTAASFAVSTTDLLQTQFSSYSGDALNDHGTNDTLYLTQLANQGITVGEASLRDGTWYNNDASSWGSTTGAFSQIGKATAESRGSALAQSGEFSIFNFDVSTNTLGYDITGVDLFSNWGSGDGRNEIKVQISFALVGTPTVFDQSILTPAAYNPVSTGDVDGTQGLMSITDDSGNIASGIAAVRFDWLSPQENGAVGYSEIDVFGTATIPEPSSALLLGLGSLTLLRRRKA